MYDILNPVIDVIASNERIAAAVVAGLAAILLYGILGRRFLGADARFWTSLRRWALPRLDAFGSKTGLYAEGSSNWNEYAGTLYAPSLAEVERHLEGLGYLRNPLAAYKTAPDGRQSVGSWAKRFGYIDGTGRTLKALGDAPDLIPGTGFVERLLGNLLIGISDILALRQRHPTLYVRDWGSGVAVDVFVHDEPNSINPITAFQHYRLSAQDPDGHGGVWDADAGVQGFRDDVQALPDGPGWSEDGIQQDGAEAV